MRIGINGFGRMGRLALRESWDWPGIEFAHINEIAGDAEVAAHLLEFDSVHGRWNRNIGFDGSNIHVDGKTIPFTRHPSPRETPWEDFGVDVVIECSGKFKTEAALAPYFEKGVRKVVVAAPVKEGALNIVMGVNDDLYDPKRHHLVTAASCTTNCLAPVVKVIHEALGIRHGMITTIHDITNTQVLVDRPHKDLRRARSAVLSMIPTTTGSATAITMIYPELKGKLNGLAVRVPMLNGSLTDCVFELERKTDADTVNALFQDAAAGPLKGILGYEKRPLVSADYVNDRRSSIVDGPSTMVTDGTQLKILAWYDNEIGYVNRMMELVSKIGASLGRKAA
ncbi:MAG: ArsJ-associated glyceraldehyde-3-phosphate dehydrogenase [Alphaproteobacteria bacterium]